MQFRDLSELENSSCVNKEGGEESYGFVEPDTQFEAAFTRFDIHSVGVQTDESSPRSKSTSEKTSGPVSPVKAKSPLKRTLPPYLQGDLKSTNFKRHEKEPEADAESHDNAVELLTARCK